MADIKANALPTATPALTDKLFGIGSSQEYQAAISDIASVILTSYTNSSLGTSSKNIVGAINELNGKNKIYTLALTIASDEQRDVNITLDSIIVHIMAVGASPNKYAIYLLQPTADGTLVSRTLVTGTGSTDVAYEINSNVLTVKNESTAYQRGLLLSTKTIYI